MEYLKLLSLCIWRYKSDNRRHNFRSEQGLVPPLFLNPSFFSIFFKEYERYHRVYRYNKVIAQLWDHYISRLKVHHSSHRLFVNFIISILYDSSTIFVKHTYICIFLWIFKEYHKGMNREENEACLSTFLWRILIGNINFLIVHSGKWHISHVIIRRKNS